LGPPCSKTSIGSDITAVIIMESLSLWTGWGCWINPNPNWQIAWTLFLVGCFLYAAH
jgi:hypothetical protein